MKVTLYGQPVSTRQVYRTGVRGGQVTEYVSNDGLCLREEYRQQMRVLRKAPYKAQLLVVVDLYFADKTKYTCDGFHRALMDAGAEILWDDVKQIDGIVLRKRTDKENPRIELTIVPMNKDNPQALVTITANGSSHYFV